MWSIPIPVKWRMPQCLHLYNTLYLVNYISTSAICLRRDLTAIHIYIYIYIYIAVWHSGLGTLRMRLLYLLNACVFIKSKHWSIFCSTKIALNSIYIQSITFGQLKRGVSLRGYSNRHCCFPYLKLMYPICTSAGIFTAIDFKTT